MAEQFPIKLSITRIDKHTANVWSFFMVPQQAARPEFIAGQVAVLEMSECGHAYFAFASAPEDAECEFLIKRGQPTQIAGALFDPHLAKPVALANIIGHGFPLEAHRGADLVFVAMGTGLAPLRSALRHVFQARDDYGQLVVLYGARTIDDFCFEDEMQREWRRHGVELRQVISRPDEREWSGPTGYVQGLLDHVVPDLKQPVALVCGSKPMMEQTRARLLELGFAPEKILTNY
jgi:sulfhydrogenase subunit gamma (sulfur reductase)